MNIMIEGIRDARAIRLEDGADAVRLTLRADAGQPVSLTMRREIATGIIAYLAGIAAPAAAPDPQTRERLRHHQTPLEWARAGHDVETGLMVLLLKPEGQTERGYLIRPDAAATLATEMAASASPP